MRDISLLFRFDVVLLGVEGSFPLVLAPPLLKPVLADVAGLKNFVIGVVPSSFGTFFLPAVDFLLT